MFVELKKDYLNQPAGARIDVDEPVAQALITQQVARACDADPLAPVINRSIESLLGNVTKSLNDTIDATLKQFAAELAKSRKNAVPAIFGNQGSGDPRRTFGKFLLAVRTGDQKAIEEMGGRWADWDGGVAQKAALNTNVGVQGGYVVPEEFQTQLLLLTAEMSVVESRATKIPMATRVVNIPALDVVTAPAAGDTAFFGGLTATWTEEAAAMTEKEPAFKQIELKAHELSGYTLASNALLADEAIGLEALLQRLLSDAISWYKDYAFLRGSGVGKPLGVLNANALISITRAANSSFNLADAAGMLGRLLPGGDERTIVWAMHPTVYTKMVQMVGGQNLVFMLNDVTRKPRVTLFGYPVERTEKLPALNTLGDVLLLDLRHYLVGDRQQIEIAYSDHYRFTNNQGTWRFVARCDGQPWLRSAITLADGSNTLSPFVGLNAG
jgi:HK97 family phage major capsid protein